MPERPKPGTDFSAVIFYGQECRPNPWRKDGRKPGFKIWFGIRRQAATMPGFTWMVKSYGNHCPNLGGLKPPPFRRQL
jgi:hypothetical protein